MRDRERKQFACTRKQRVKGALARHQRVAMQLATVCLEAKSQWYTLDIVELAVGSITSLRLRLFLKLTLWQ
eukprot:1596122-Amphidinium_carterae.1